MGSTDYWRDGKAGTADCSAAIATAGPRDFSGHAAAGACGERNLERPSRAQRHVDCNAVRPFSGQYNTLMSGLNLCAVFPA
jgi:hypothetical protein